MGGWPAKIVNIVGSGAEKVTSLHAWPAGLLQELQELEVQERLTEFSDS